MIFSESVGSGASLSVLRTIHLKYQRPSQLSSPTPCLPSMSVPEYLATTWNMKSATERGMMIWMSVNPEPSYPCKKTDNPSNHCRGCLSLSIYLSCFYLPPVVD